MMRHTYVLLTIFISYSAYSFGVMIPYKNNTGIYYSSKENISITCSGTDEVTWTYKSILPGNYTIYAETPYRKLLQIRNASVHNAGTYECASTKNRNEFMYLYLFPDESCFIDAGATARPGGHYEITY